MQTVALLVFFLFVNCLSKDLATSIDLASTSLFVSTYCQDGPVPCNVNAPPDTIKTEQGPDLGECILECSPCDLTTCNRAIYTRLAGDTIYRNVYLLTDDDCAQSIQQTDIFTCGVCAQSTTVSTISYYWTCGVSQTIISLFSLFSLFLIYLL